MGMVMVVLKMNKIEILCIFYTIKKIRKENLFREESTCSNFFFFFL